MEQMTVSHTEWSDEQVKMTKLVFIG